MDWYWWLLIAIGINWVGSYVISWLYAGWLWLITKNIKFEKWVGPVAVFRLIQKKDSWFTRAWRMFTGHSLLGVIILNSKREEVLVHELRHNAQQAILGLIWYMIYGVDYLINGYYNIWFEKDARRAERNWKKRR